MFVKNVLKTTWNCFNTKFQPQVKDRKCSYQLRSILELLSNFFALILNYDSVKDLRVTKNDKASTFEEVWDRLEPKKFCRDNNSKIFETSSSFHVQ